MSSNGLSPERGVSTVRSGWVGLVVLLAACGSGAAATRGGSDIAGRDGGASLASASGPTRVIFFIGDGTGLDHWSAALAVDSALAIRRFPVIGLVDTRNVQGRITDSGAAATAFGTGERTYNGAVGVGPDSLARTDLVEQAEGRGLATGLVATSSITDATPASFAAHVPSRSDQATIARQLSRDSIEVLLGGGLDFFDGARREDHVDLLDTLRARAAVVTDPAGLAALNPDTVDALVGLFAPVGMEPAPARRPTLEAMTRAALSVLDHDPDGFFLMVEGSQVDWRAHANAPLSELVAEVTDLDRAIAAALEYRDDHPETLIVVTADHETGGLAVEEDRTGAPTLDYTSGGHTGALVPLFAVGPGAEAFGGIKSNAQVGKLLAHAVEGGGPEADVR